MLVFLKNRSVSSWVFASEVAVLKSHRQQKKSFSTSRCTHLSMYLTLLQQGRNKRRASKSMPPQNSSTITCTLQANSQSLSPLSTPTSTTWSTWLCVWARLRPWQTCSENLCIETSMTTCSGCILSQSSMHQSSHTTSAA